MDRREKGVGTEVAVIFEGDTHLLRGAGLLKPLPENWVGLSVHSAL